MDNELGVTHHNVIELVCAHEGGHNDLTGQDAFVTQYGGLGPQNHGGLRAHSHTVTGAVYPDFPAADLYHIHFTLVAQHLALQEVGIADKVGNELTDGMVVDLVGGTHLGDLAGVHNDDLVGDGHGLGLVMGDIDGGDARLLLNAADLGTHGDPELGIQVGKRLVKQQHTGLHNQGSCQGDTLLLAAGKLVRHTGFHAGQAHQLQDVRYLLLDDILGKLTQLQAIGHIVKNIVVGKQRVALEHHGGIPLVGGQLIDLLAAQPDTALVGAFKAGDHTKRCGLAAAGGAQQCDEAARLDVQAHLIDRVEILLGLGVNVNFGNTVQFNALFLF